MASPATDRLSLSCLISDHHRSLYRCHFDSRSAGSKPSRWQGVVEALAERFDARSIIDYGCAIDASLSRFSTLPIINYDPAISEYSALPERADLVVCLHVLEHVEEDCIDHVLEHLRGLAKKALFIAVSTESSTKTLPDGSPWHSFVKDAAWWREKLVGFDEQRAMDARKEYVALLTC